MPWGDQLTLVPGKVHGSLYHSYIQVLAFTLTNHLLRSLLPSRPKRDKRKRAQLLLFEIDTRQVSDRAVSMDQLPQNRREQM